MPSFIKQIPHLVGQGPIVNVRIGIDKITKSVMQQKNITIPESIQVNALMDTGASHTYISPNVVGRLNLIPHGITQTLTAGNPVNTNTYNIYLDIGVEFRVLLFLDPIAVAEAPLIGQSNIDCIIGRNILAQGIFIYMGYVNSFSFSI